MDKMTSPCGQYPADYNTLMVSGSGNSTYLAVRDDINVLNYSEVLDVRASNDFVRVRIHGVRYRMYEADHLLCPACGEKKWAACAAASHVIERKCRCADPAGLPSIWDRMLQALGANAGCPGCIHLQHAAVHEPGSADTPRIARHAVCCPVVDGLPMTTTPNAMLDALRLVREDYARRLAESNNSRGSRSGSHTNAGTSHPGAPGRRVRAGAS